MDLMEECGTHELPVCCEGHRPLEKPWTSHFIILPKCWLWVFNVADIRLHLCPCVNLSQNRLKTFIKVIWDQTRMVLREIELEIFWRKIQFTFSLTKSHCTFCFWILTSTDCSCWSLHLETCWCSNSPASPDYPRTCH